MCTSLPYSRFESRTLLRLTQNLLFLILNDNKVLRAIGTWKAEKRVISGRASVLSLFPHVDSLVTPLVVGTLQFRAGGSGPCV